MYICHAASADGIFKANVSVSIKLAKIKSDRKLAAMQRDSFCFTSKILTSIAPTLLRTNVENPRNSYII
jgi:hypothetical protein